MHYIKAMQVDIMRALVWLMQWGFIYTMLSHINIRLLQSQTCFMSYYTIY